MERLAVAVDLGGTFIKVGLIDSNGTIHYKELISTPTIRGEDTIIEEIASSVEAILLEQNIERRSLTGVGLGVPGFLDQKSGVVTLAPNIGWSNYPARAKLEEKLGITVTLDNDANCAALGERWLGAGKMVDNMVMVTLGTGVGGGVIINKEIVRGQNGMGGEIGHITVNPNGVICGCGKFGCLETEASATAIRRKAIEGLKLGEVSRLQSIWQEKQDVTAREVADAAKQDDPFALQLFEQAARSLALVLSGITHTLNPEKIIMGGGISAVGAPLFSPLQSYFAQYTLPSANHKGLLCPAELGNDAGMFGAAYMVFQNCIPHSTSDTIDA